MSILDPSTGFFDHVDQSPLGALAGGAGAAGIAGAGMFDDIGGATEYYGGFGTSTLDEAFMAARGESTAESIFSFLRSGASDAADYYFDYLLFKDARNSFNHNDFKHEWDACQGAEKTTIESIKDIAKIHGSLLGMMKKFYPNDQATKDYQALGVHLPSEELLKQVKRKLSMALHPDRQGGNEEQFKEFDDYIKTLQDKDKVTAYNEMAAKKPDAIKEILGKMSEAHYDEWIKPRTPETNPARLLESSTSKGKETLEKEENFFTKLSPTNKAAVILGSAVVVGGTAYVVSKIADEKNKKAHKTSTNSWVENISASTPTHEPTTPYKR